MVLQAAAIDPPHTTLVRGGKRMRSNPGTARSRPCHVVVSDLPACRSPARPRPRFVVRPLAGPPEGIDMTRALVAAIAFELWQRDGGNAVLNWLEAERLLEGALFRSRQLSHPSALPDRQR